MPLPFAASVVSASRASAASIAAPVSMMTSEKAEEIPWHKVAGFDYLSGIFWDRVRIETRGQSSTELPCLAKSDGKRIREVLQQLEQ